VSPLPSEEHFREMRAARVSGAALDAPQIGPDEDQGIEQSSLEQIEITESSQNNPWSLEFSGHFPHSDRNVHCFMARDITAIGRTLGV